MSNSEPEVSLYEVFASNPKNQAGLTAAKAVLEEEMKREKEGVYPLPFEFDDFDNIDGKHYYNEAVFTRDFGIFKNGECLDVEVDFWNGLLIGYGPVGSEPKKQKFRMEAV